MSAIGGITLDGAVLTTMGGIAGAAVTGFFAWLKLREKRGEKLDALKADKDKREEESDREWSDLVRDFIDKTNERLTACESDREELRARITGQTQLIHALKVEVAALKKQVAELGGPAAP